VTSDVIGLCFGAVVSDFCLVYYARLLLVCLLISHILSEQKDDGTGGNDDNDDDEDDDDVDDADDVEKINLQLPSVSSLCQRL